MNERLFGAGLLDAFDNCINGSDDEGAVAILTKVELSPRKGNAIKVPTSVNFRQSSKIGKHCPSFILSQENHA